MKKTTSQVVVAFVCACLGFLLSYQFKVLSKNDTTYTGADNSNILEEIENLKKEKDELANTNAALTEELKNIEESVTQEGEVEKEIKKQLDNARMQLGLVDVKGPGVVIKITPKTNIFGASSNEVNTDLDETEIINIINLLWFSRAEAISVNDFRITPQTGIKTSGNYLWVGSAGNKVSPKETITIKAIGDKTRINVALSFQSNYNLTTGKLANYDVGFNLLDSVEISKTTQKLKVDFLQPVNE